MAGLDARNRLLAPQANAHPTSDTASRPSCYATPGQVRSNINYSCSSPGSLRY